MSRWSARRAAFRRLLEDGQCVYPASVFDAMSVRIAEDLGYECAMLAGSVASLTVLGAPDRIVLTLSEFAAQTYRISRAGELPLLVDADHGYGNALNVMRTVEELENAGVAALSIEDTVLPEPFAAAQQPKLLALAEGVGKMRAAVRARTDPSLVIAGRTSAARLSNAADAAARVLEYQRAGVDAIFLVGVGARADLEQILTGIEIPVILGGAGGDLRDRAYLASQGVRVCLQGHQPIMAAVQAVQQTLAALRAGTAPADLTGIANAGLMAKVSRDSDYEGWAREFLDPPA